MQPLFITHKYPPSIGGMEKQSYELIKGMSSRFDVKSLVFDGTISRFKFFLTLLPAVKKILSDNPGISFIHLNDGLMAVFGLLIRRITDVPIFVTLHGLDIVFPNKFYQKHIVNRFRIFDGLIPVSSATASECIKRGIDPEKIFTIPNGVDRFMGEIKKQDNFREKLENQLSISLKGKKILVSVGRAVTRKGFSWFIENVMTKLDNEIIYLIIGASNDSTKRLQSLLKYFPSSIARQISLLFAVETDKLRIHEVIMNCALEKRVFILGKQDFDTMIQILNHADLFIMPNIKVHGDAEGFGLVALEAAICGLPVLASKLEGITDAIMNAKNGYLIEPGNADTWITFIKKLLTDPESLKRFGKQAKEFTSHNYSWEKMVNEYTAVFKQNIKKMVSGDENIAVPDVVSLTT